MGSEDFRILLTGSRDWVDEALIWDALYPYLPARGSLMHTVTLVHGDCPTGADALASLLWTANGGLEEPHPAQWDLYGKAAGPIRNRKMVELGAGVCLAFPLGRSAGTRGCMRLAEAAGIPVINYGDDHGI